MNTLVRRERYLDGLLAHFRNRWKKEYLKGICEYQKLKGGERRRVIQVGDIVHIYADKTPRQRWRLGKEEGKEEKLLWGQDNVALSGSDDSRQFPPQGSSETSNLETLSS